MEEDTQRQKSEEVDNILPRDSLKSDADNGYKERSGPHVEEKRILEKTQKEEKLGTTLDEELVKIRGNSSYLIVISSLMVSFAFAELMVFAVPFLELIPPMECNINGEWLPCLKEQACNPEIEHRIIMEDKYTLDNWVDDLDLICKTDWEIGIIGSSCFAGMFIGALTLSPIADIYGRRPVHITGLVLSLIGSVWMYFFPTWLSVIVSLVLKGIGMYCRMSISYLYTLEMFDEERCKIIAAVMMSFNNALSSIMAMYFMFGGRDATFFLFCSIFILMYCIIFIPILPESPKLLYSKKDYESTRECLSKIAHVNGIKYKKVVFQEEAEMHKLMGKEEGEQLVRQKTMEGKKVDFTILCRKPAFLLNLCITIFIFMFNVFSMYMISFMLKYLPGDKYMNLFLLGVADFIPSVMSGVVMKLMPTKRGLILGHILICGFIIFHLFFGGIEWLGMPCIFFIRLTITLVNCLDFYVVYELFPAKFASVVYGGCNIAAGLVSILSPMAVEIFAEPLLIVLTLGVVCVILCIVMIPGTKTLI